MADPVFVDGMPLNPTNMNKLQTRDEKAAVNGYAGLGANGKVPVAQGGVPDPVVNGQWIKGVGGAAVWAPITPADLTGLVDHRNVTVTAANTDLAWPGGSAPTTYINITTGGGTLRTLGAPTLGDGALCVIRAATSAPVTILFNTTGTGRPFSTVYSDNPQIIYPMTVGFVYDGNYWVEIFRDPLPIQYGTALPTSPVDGQEFVLTSSLTVPVWQWHMRYNAGSTRTEKWECIGGVPVKALNNTTFAINPVNTWLSPSVSLTLQQGVYIVRAMLDLDINANTQAHSIYTGLSIATNAITNGFLTPAVFLPAASGRSSIWVTDQIALGAGGGTIYCLVQSTLVTPTPDNVRAFWIEAMPVRLA